MAVEIQANEPGFVLVPREPTEAMLDAAHEVPIACFEDDVECFTTNREASSLYRSMLAAAPIVPAPAYGVKALEWEAPYDGEDGNPVYGTLSPLGRYLATDEGWFVVGLTGWHKVAGLNEAKAAAQADFERRVLSCLSTHTAAGAGPVEEADAKAASLYGPYGWIVKPVGLAEDEWELEADPEEDTVNFVSVPLYAAEPQALGVTAPPAPTIPSEPEAKGEAGADHECRPDPMAPERCVTCGKRFRLRNHTAAGAGPVGEAMHPAIVSALAKYLVQYREGPPKGIKLERWAHGVVCALGGVVDADLSTQESSAALAGDGKGTGR